MEYVLALFPDGAAAERAAGSLRSLGLGENDYRVKTHAAATRSAKRWAEWLFETVEARPGTAAESLPQDDIYWYEDRIRAGEALVAVRLEDRGGPEVWRALRRAGGHDVRRYWARVTVNYRTTA
ncbi:MAG TPA: hypothetical protein VGX75_00745 [bacterium]|nr:hypothetical protein [bacterium]